METYANPVFLHQQTAITQRLDHVAGHVMQIIMSLVINVFPILKIVVSDNISMVVCVSIVLVNLAIQSIHKLEPVIGSVIMDTLVMEIAVCQHRVIHGILAAGITVL